MLIADKNIDKGKAFDWGRARAQTTQNTATFVQKNFTTKSLHADFARPARKCSTSGLEQAFFREIFTATAQTGRRRTFQKSRLSRQKSFLPEKILNIS